MKFVVCVKQVPDTTEVGIDEKTGTIIREGIPSVLNPFDEYALNVAIKLREEVDKDIEVIALSMGPPQAEDALKKCLAIGADKAILLSDKVFAGADTWATSLTLAKAIKKVGEVSMIFCGQEATDGNTGQVGPEIGRLLNIPGITYIEEVEEINFEEKYIICKKETDEGYIRIKSKNPALIACITPPDFEPRIPSVKDIMKAGQKTLLHWGYEKIGGNKGEFGLDGSQSRVIRIYAPPRKGLGIKIDDEPEIEAEKILEFLKERAL